MGAPSVLFRQQIAGAWRRSVARQSVGEMQPGHAFRGKDVTLWGEVAGSVEVADHEMDVVGPEGALESERGAAARTKAAPDPRRGCVVGRRRAFEADVPAPKTAASHERASGRPSTGFAVAELDEERLAPSRKLDCPAEATPRSLDPRSTHHIISLESGRAPYSGTRSDRAQVPGNAPRLSRRAAHAFLPVARTDAPISDESRHRAGDPTWARFRAKSTRRSLLSPMVRWSSCRRNTPVSPWPRRAPSSDVASRGSISSPCPPPPCRPIC